MAQSSMAMTTNRSTKPTIPWYRKLDWTACTISIILPLCALLSTPWVPLHPKTACLAILHFLLAGLSVTAGYHRLWSHRSYIASPLLKVFMALFGAAAFQSRITTWARMHRAHHRFTDTERDPYGINKGFWYAHILWALFKHPDEEANLKSDPAEEEDDDDNEAKKDKENPSQNYYISISDLQNDPIVTFFDHYFAPLAIFMSWILPTLIAHLFWSDAPGGLIYAGLLRMSLNQQSILCINSVAHYLGTQPYDDATSPRNHVLAAVLSLGEGYHNFHHAFPSDYRNGIQWYDVDMTKWWIAGCAGLGLAHDLKRFRESEIEKARVQQARKGLERATRALDWGPRLEELPVMSWNEFQGRSGTGGVYFDDGRRTRTALVCVEGVVHDVSGFLAEHPGGEGLLRRFVGRDATAAFNGGVYGHSKVARNVLATMRVAVLNGGGEVEVWKTTLIT